MLKECRYKVEHTRRNRRIDYDFEKSASGESYNMLESDADDNEFKGALSGLRHFLATESPLKIMKNAFYFTSNALFVLKIFKFLS